MKLETELPVPDRDARRVVEKNFRTLIDEDVKDDCDVQKTMKRVENLEATRITHEELNETRSELQKRINHLYAGDPRTIKKVVYEILKDEGVI